MGKITCVCDNAQADLKDIFATNMADGQDVEKVVQYCINHQKIGTILYDLPTGFFAYLSHKSLVSLYSELELKRIALDKIGKWLDNRDAPRYEQLKMYLEKSWNK